MYKYINVESFFKNLTDCVPPEMMWNIEYKLREEPTLDVEPVRHGRWVNKKRWGMGKWHKWLECSECNYQDYSLETYEAIPFTGISNYCPNCGAKMDLEEKKIEKIKREESRAH